jgi:serine phosphatase RsbU (regulator of sigma subunit)
MVCFFAGVLDREELSFTYANAGWSTRTWSQRPAFELPVSGSALGFAASVMYPERQIQLEIGDGLFVYSDGLVEHSERAPAFPSRRPSQPKATETTTTDGSWTMSSRA